MTAEELTHEYVHIALVVAFTAVVFLFKLQTLDVVTVSLFAVSLTLPVSLLVLLVYIKWLEAATDRAGGVRVQPDLSVPGHPQVFVIRRRSIRMAIRCPAWPKWPCSKAGTP